MQRREFIAGLGSAAAWPVMAQAQQQLSMRRIGVLMPGTEGDPDGRLRVTGFQEGLAKLGWTEAGNVQIDYRWGALDPDRMRIFASELVGLRPDVLLAGNTTALAALQRATRSIPPQSK